MKYFLFKKSQGIKDNRWTGGLDIGAEGDWKWLSSCQPVGDFVWSPNQPDGRLDDNCLDLNYNFGYLAFDALCDLTYYPICQFYI